jgi:hypothetical protein
MKQSLRRLLELIRRHPWRTAVTVLLAGFLLLNLLAVMHARAMMTFVPAGVKTPPPESLSVMQKA